MSDPANDPTAWFETINAHVSALAREIVELRAKLAAAEQAAVVVECPACGASTRAQMAEVTR